MEPPRASAGRDRGEESVPVVTQEIAAEAAVWIARLHGPDRSIAMERECLAWQQRSAAHRVAFERCTETWQEVPRVSLINAYSSFKSQRPPKHVAASAGRTSRSRRVLALVCAGLMAGVVLYLEPWRRGEVYVADRGEQRAMVLSDGTRLSLNTDTRVRVEMSSSRRSVELQRGEALFEVAKDATRPFVVRAADSEVVAVGTAFMVRLSTAAADAQEALAVTLLEGKVTVRGAAGTRVDGVAPAEPLAMQAGERVRLVKARRSASPALQQIDRPRLEQVVAWKRSEVIFDDVSLADALNEMNRYSRTPIVLVGNASLARLRVSGLYRTGDSAGFARAVAALHGLAVRERQGRLELTPPQ